MSSLCLTCTLSEACCSFLLSTLEARHSASKCRFGSTIAHLVQHYTKHGCYGSRRNRFRENGLRRSARWIRVQALERLLGRGDLFRCHSPTWPRRGYLSNKRERFLEARPRRTRCRDQRSVGRSDPHPHGHSLAFVQSRRETSDGISFVG